MLQLRETKMNEEHGNHDHKENFVTQQLTKDVGINGHPKINICSETGGGRPQDKVRAEK